MARQHRSNLGRYAYYLQRKVEVTLHGLRPSALRGRLQGPRVLVNSIPKSGTHLVEHALGRFPLLRHAGRRTVTDWSEASPRTLRHVRGIRRGQFLLAHLPAFDELLAALRAESIKTLFVVRDPRDVLVSYCKYLTEIHLVHPSHAHFASLPDDGARLWDAIHGVADVVVPVDELLERYAGWLDADGVLVVSFEELIGAKGGGSARGQHSVLSRIAEFLAIELSPQELARIAASVFSTRSSTFREGSIGQWRRAFGPEHERAFEERAGALLERYGYARGGVS